MKKALVIGLNNYSAAPLHGCINDARAMQRILSNNTDGSPNFDVRLITDEKESISKSCIKSAIKQLFDDDDTALLYFSGHGYTNVYGGYIVTPDFQQYDEGINMDEVLNVANKSEARNKFIILDCCHSGVMGNPSLNKECTQISQGMTILTACKNSESALERNNSGVFTNLLLEALDGGAADLNGNITAGSIYWFVDKALGPWEQRPVFKTNVNSYAPIRTTTPPIPLTTLRKITNYFNNPDFQFPLDPSFEYTESCAIKKNVIIFQDLQKYQSVGLVKPVGEEFMYWAAKNSKSCKLTTVGKCYWHFANDNRL